MPLIKSAKKKLRKDKKVTVRNANVRKLLKDTIKKAKKAPTEEALRLLAKIADKAAKQHIIHKNKAARIKSKLAKLLKSAPAKSTAKAPIKKTKKKA